MIDKDKNPDFLNAFLDYSITILNKSPNSIKEYSYDLNMFLRFLKMHLKLTKETDLDLIQVNDFSIEDLKKVKLEDIHRYLAYLTEKSRSKAATRARKVSSIRVFFNYLSSKAGLLEVNPAQNLETPKLDKRLPKYLNLDESKKLLEVSLDEENKNGQRNYAILTLFLNCGMRLSELVGINIKDIDFDECKLNIIGKGNKERVIYLNKACMKAISAYLEVRPKEGIKYDSKDALFLSERRERISKRTVQYIVEKELDKAGLSSKNLSVHKLRHTAATLMYQYGNVDIRALQELLGHESIATTEIYTHVAMSKKRDILATKHPRKDFDI